MKYNNQADDMMLLDIPDEKLEFPQCLRKRWLQYFLKNNGNVSQNDFAKHLGLSSNTILTNYMLGNRRPSFDQAEILADKLGPWVYDKLGYPRRMPRDKGLLFVVDALSNNSLFTEQERKEIIEEIKNRAREAQERQERVTRNSNATA